jgi:transcriptional regulator NrdR family protein
VKHIVKRRGHKEAFDEKKIYASCYAACLSAHLNHLQAEKICATVTRDIAKWIRKKKEVTSHQIFLETAKSIKKHHREAAFMYATHRDIS